MRDLSLPNRPPPGAFSRRPSPPWAAATGLSAVLQHWSADAGMQRNLVLQRTLPEKAAHLVQLPDTLAEPVRAALTGRAVTRLYRHQADALSAVARGEHVVVSTPTASGKSLCYHLPVLNLLAQEPEARALYLFPTKALSRDQEESLRALMRDAGLAHGAITYDGDTPGDARRKARERSGVLLSNPDMLHAGILPHHASWARFFANLKVVVLDELHTYRGVFGSHLANVLRRLYRVARFHGSNPRFIFASATIGNPQEHAERMVAQPVTLIDQSGAPQGERHVMVYNPPVVNEELGIRASYIKTSVRLALELVRAKVPTLIFGQSRNSVETMLKYLRDGLAQEQVDPSCLVAYRGGYLADTRRRIEQGLRAGVIRCVVATNALELGIDIGSLEAVVCAGYPGSVAGLWQRFGRSGRRQGASLSLLVTSSMPLDQYVANDPSRIVGAPVEEARVDPDNVEILIQHLKCAAFELPFESGESFADVPEDAVRDALNYLEQHRLVHAAPGRGGKEVWHWSSESYPANHVSLRSVGWDNFVVIDLDRNKTIAEMDWRATHTMLHVQAIYQHEGEQYQVERLDYENHKAYVRKVVPDYYTDAMTYTKVSVLAEEDAAVLGAVGDRREAGVGGDPPPELDGPLERDESTEKPEAAGNAPRHPTAAHPVVVGTGEVSVVEKVVGYKKIKFHTHENCGYGDVRLPEMQMHTAAVWWTVPESVVEALALPRAAVLDALRGLSHAMHLTAAIGLMTDPRDIGRTLGDRDEEGVPSRDREQASGFDPTIFLYDNIPGGVGLASRLFVERDAVLRRSRSLVEACPCEHGCPACIGPAEAAAPPPGRETDASAARAALATNRKALVMAILDLLAIPPTH